MKLTVELSKQFVALKNWLSVVLHTIVHCVQVLLTSAIGVRSKGAHGWSGIGEQYIFSVHFGGETGPLLGVFALGSPQQQNQYLGASLLVIV